MESSIERALQIESLVVSGGPEQANVFPFNFGGLRSLTGPTTPSARVWRHACAVDRLSTSGIDNSDFLIDEDQFQFFLQMTTPGRLLVRGSTPNEGQDRVPRDVDS